MSQQKLRARRQAASHNRKSRNRRKSTVVITLILCLGLTSLIMAGRSGWRYAFGPPAPLPTPTPAPQLSKEYIYAGGKLVAMEEPTAAATPTPPVVPAPSNLTATAQFSNQTLTGVALHWTAPTGSVDHFRIERAQNKNGPWTVPSLPNPGATDTTFTDTTASPNVAYLYRICGADSQGNLSTYSNLDLSTTVWFADDPLVGWFDNPRNGPPTVISATHFTQLRNAINAVRKLVDPNAADFQWTSLNNQPPPPQSGGGIYASHLTDLRTNLATALSALNLPSVNYEYPTITAHVSVVHKKDIQELRDAVR